MFTSTLTSYLLSFMTTVSSWHVLSALAVIFLTYVVSEQIALYQRKRNLPGPSMVWPLIGGLVEMVLDPQAFWQRQDKYGALSWNYLAGKLLIHSKDPEVCRKMLSHDTPSELKMKLHPNAEAILGSNNIAFMQGKAHKELRGQLLPLFTRRALSFYLQWQDELVRQYMKEWVAKYNKQEVEFRPLARSLNTITSYRVFLGTYLDEQQMKVFSKHYQEMNDGFLTFPVNLPGTALNRAIKARKIVVAMLEDVTRHSKARMEKGEEPGCLLDFWMEKMVALIQEAKTNNTPLPEHHEDYEIACTVLDFLFASQDASTSSLVWTVAIMDEFPQVFEKVREEQRRVRPNDELITQELIAEMPYTRQVVKEILRLKTPATFVPQEAQQDFQLTDDFVVPKGTILIPSLWECTKQGYENPYAFDPDRFSPERDEDKKYSKNFLVFGTGPHTCMGKDYAVNHLTAFLSLMATNLQWKRRKTEKSDKIFFGPTIYPWDCLVTIEPLKKKK